MSGGYFFGYGSLVNTATHSFAEAHPAQLKGWRRMWRKTTMRQAAYLTVVPDSEAEIDGLIAEVPHGDWEALDERERAYARVDAAHQVSHPLPAMPAIVVYAIEDGRHGTPDRQSPVLLSYIDVVVQGYLHNFGEAGVQRFFDTTGVGTPQWWMIATHRFIRDINPYQQMNTCSSMTCLPASEPYANR
ncbi:gamma-glutamylcyclotransferase family protein [Roseovarius rhodophyticola]|uniref:Gamma-glutamylcyclotransferase family protein n=1 Tax=Roseovarius rhodophyticola TaxID=3080827 RepID=A0ABZ2TCX7_9RHOB